jgi:phage/plasmid primase-like uncharacterized protein
MINHIEEFRAAMSAGGLVWDGPINDDGKIHRFKPEGDKSDCGWYVLHRPDPLAAGKFGCWKRNPEGASWCQKNGADYSKQELSDMRRKWSEADRQREADDKARHERMAKVAQEYFTGLKPPAFNHGYFQEKMVCAYGSIVENNQGDLALPLQDINGKIWSYQTIDCFGDKLFMTAGRVSGLFYSVCDKADGPLVICEGYATGATIHEATGYATYCAMNCGNLEEVSKACREKWKDRTILIAADNDRFTKKQGEPHNPGLEKARKAAAAIKAVVVLPEFPDGSKGTDFNDLDKECGREKVVSAFDRAYPCPLSVMSFEQIGQIPTQISDCLYGDHLLDKGGCLVIAGQGGTGKTRLIYQMIAAPHMGREKFLTFDIHPGARNFKWLVLQVENGVERLKSERQTLIKMLGTHYSRFNEFVRVLTPVTENDTFVNLDNPENLRRLQQTIEHQLPDGIIFDSLYDFGIGDLNKDSDMRSTLTAITRLARHRNPKRAIIVLHHATTGSSGAAKATGYDRSSFARNSKVIYNWARAQINIAPATGESNDQLIVSCGKCSNGKEFHSFAVKLDPDTMRYGVDSSIDVAEWSREMGGKSKNDPEITPQETADMCGAGASKPVLSKKVMESIGCSRMSAYRHINRAVKKGLLRESGEMLFRNSL